MKRLSFMSIVLLLTFSNCSDDDDLTDGSLVFKVDSSEFLFSAVDVGIIDREDTDSSTVEVLFMQSTMGSDTTRRLELNIVDKENISEGVYNIGMTITNTNLLFRESIGSRVITNFRINSTSSLEIKINEMDKQDRMISGTIKGMIGSLEAEQVRLKGSFRNLRYINYP